MKLLLGALLLMSSLAAATPTNPNFSFNAFIAPRDHTVEFFGEIFDGNHNSSAVFTTTGGVNFGDGQVFQTTSRNFTTEHIYEHGEYTATLFFDVVGYWLFFPLTGTSWEDLQEVPINQHFEQTYRISAAPEPTTYIMILIGLLCLATKCFRRPTLFFQKLP